MVDDDIRNKLNFLEKELVEEIIRVSELHEFNQNMVLIREGQYPKYLPVVIEGMVNVYSQFDDKELLLYYIKPNQSCIISFAAAIYNHPSRIFAVTAAASRVLLMPAGAVPGWTARYSKFNRLFFDLYHERYLDLLDTVNQLIFTSMDDRIYNYLKSQSELVNSKILKLRHHQIAKDLGTAREVVSRLIKKLEKEEKVAQTPAGIKIL
jgi:CRP/FNR family transcriptional regulator